MLQYEIIADALRLALGDGFHVTVIVEEGGPLRFIAHKEDSFVHFSCLFDEDHDLTPSALQAWASHTASVLGKVFEFISL
jgi:hypothetical protein